MSQERKASCGPNIIRGLCAWRVQLFGDFREASCPITPGPSIGDGRDIQRDIEMNNLLNPLPCGGTTVSFSNSVEIIISACRTLAPKDGAAAQENESFIFDDEIRERLASAEPPTVFDSTTWLAIMLFQVRSHASNQASISVRVERVQK